ncbi:hypothetical protein D6D02_01974 [Aureobasidium pullulans]|nr:hypothetical protein D6D02_01974 [Aureobasidium pullulans]
MEPTNKQCAVCSEPGKLCGSCENIHYCGPVCQKADWKVHKLLCRSFKAARDPPGPDMMRVIAFPFHSAKPEFLWMPIKPGEVKRPLPGKFFGSGGFGGPGRPALTDELSFVQDIKTGKRLHHRITVQFRDEFRTDGSLPNASVLALTGGPCLKKFAGPVLVFGNTDTKEGEKIQSIDLDTSDLNVIKDWFAIGFYECENEQLYMDRLMSSGNVQKKSDMIKLTEAYEQELRTKGRPIPKFSLDDIDIKKWLEYNEALYEFKKGWDAKNKADNPTEQRDFSKPMDKEELAWREELRISGRYYDQSSAKEVLERQEWIPKGSR